MFLRKHSLASLTFNKHWAELCFWPTAASLADPAGADLLLAEQGGVEKPPQPAKFRLLQSLAVFFIWGIRSMRGNMVTRTFMQSLVLRSQSCYFHHCCHAFKAEVTELCMKLWASAVSPWSSMEQADSNPKEQVSPTTFFAETVVLQPAGTREPPVTLPMAIHYFPISASLM